VLNTGGKKYIDNLKNVDKTNEEAEKKYIKLLMFRYKPYDIITIKKGKTNKANNKKSVDIQKAIKEKIQEMAEKLKKCENMVSKIGKDFTDVSTNK